MVFLLVYYRVTTIISIPLALFMVYLVLFKSPNRMKSLRWHILNIQMATFIESFYVCEMAAPQFFIYPLPHGAPTGILTKYFQVPPNVQVAVGIFILCLLVGTLIVAFVFRYHLLLPRSDIPVLHFIIEKMHVFAIFLGYGNGFGYSYLTYKTFLTAEDTKNLLHKLDPSYIVPPFSTTINKDWGIIIGCAVGFGYAFTLVVGGLVVHHSRNLIKHSAHHNISPQFIKSHKEAFRTLLLQVGFLYSTIIIPCLSITFAIMVGLEKIPPWAYEMAIPMCFGGFAIKSISTSITGFYTITFYRNYITRLLRLHKIKKRAGTTVVSQTVRF